MIVIILAILAIFIIAITEMVMTRSWIPYYFKIGIPIYKKYISVSTDPNLTTDMLSNKCKDLNLDQILIKQIDTNQIAFRESSVHRHFIASPAVMHGLIEYREGKLQLTGMINWIVLVFLFMFIAMASGFVTSSDFDLKYIILPIGVFTILYHKQFKQYNKIFDILKSYN